MVVRRLAVVLIVISVSAVVASLYGSMFIGRSCLTGSIDANQVLCYDLVPGDRIDWVCNNKSRLSVTDEDGKVVTIISSGQGFTVLSPGRYCVVGGPEVNAECSVTVCKASELTAVFRALTIGGGLLLVLALALVYKDITNPDKYGVKEEVRVTDRLICKSRSLTNHECRYMVRKDEDGESIVNAITEHFVNNHNYKVVRKDNSLVVLRGKIGEGISAKGVELIIYYNRGAREVIMEFRISGLRASGLLDLGKIVELFRELSSS